MWRPVVQISPYKYKFGDKELASMHLQSPTLTMLLAATCMLGCASHTEEHANEPAKESPETTARATTVRIKPIEGVPKLTEDMLHRVEMKYQCRLPQDYRRFLLQDNGGFPSPDCVTFKEAGRTTTSDVFCLHCIGDERPWASMDWHHETFAGRLPKNTLPVAHDSCGNLWLLNVGPDHGGSVIFWDHGSFNNSDETDFDIWPCVAESFQEFIGKLYEYQPLSEDEESPSRYALVQRAIEGMADKSPGFDRRTVLDGAWAWHCDFSQDGNVTMQCVKYAIHAAVTHTDGYSRLRAAKGFITAGPARLPQ